MTSLQFSQPSLFLLPNTVLPTAALLQVDFSGMNREGGVWPELWDCWVFCIWAQFFCFFLCPVLPICLIVTAVLSRLHLLFALVLDHIAPNPTVAFLVDVTEVIAYF